MDHQVVRENDNLVFSVFAPPLGGQPSSWRSKLVGVLATTSFRLSFGYFGFFASFLVPYLKGALAWALYLLFFGESLVPLSLGNMM